MMNLTPDDRTTPDADELPYDERRRHRRYATHIRAVLQGGGRSQSTIINDLSAGGAGLTSALGVESNDSVVLQLEDGRRIQGIVAWRISGCCGVQFDQELAAADPLLVEAAVYADHAARNS
jgi:hypothetical protein